MKNLIICLLVLSQVVVGCTQYRYEYIPPQDSEGIACVRACLDKKWYCSNNCQTSYSNCIASTNSGVNININNYTQQQNPFGQSNPFGQQTVDPYAMQREKHSACEDSKSSCTNNCNGFYDDCYRSCGGIINVYEVN